MIRVQTSQHNTNSGIATPSLYHQESPLRRVLKFGRRSSHKPSCLYNDLASIDSCDDYLDDLKHAHQQLHLPKDGGKLSLDKKEKGSKLPSLLSLDASGKAKAEEPGIQGITSAIDKLLFVMSSDDEQEDGALLSAKRELALAPSPTASQPITKALRKRTKPRMATTARKTDSIDSLFAPSKHIMSPRRRPRTRVCSPNASPKPKVDRSDRLCKTDHEAFKKKTSHRKDALKSSTAHPLVPLFERYSKTKKESMSLDASSEVKQRERKSSHFSSSLPRSSPKNSPRSSPKSTLKRINQKTSLMARPGVRKEVASALIQCPPLLLPATPCDRMRRRSSTGSPALVKPDGRETSGRHCYQPMSPIRRLSSVRNKALEKVEETAVEINSEMAKQSQSRKKAQIKPKRRKSLYISIYNSAPMLSSVSDTSESTYMTPNNSSHREQPYVVARTGWVPSPSGNRRHLEITWDGNNSPPSLLTASDISESNESDPCKSPSPRTEWIPSPSGHRRHLEISCA